MNEASSGDWASWANSRSWFGSPFQICKNPCFPHGKGRYMKARRAYAPLGVWTKPASSTHAEPTQLNSSVQPSSKGQLFAKMPELKVLNLSSNKLLGLRTFRAMLKTFFFCKPLGICFVLLNTFFGVLFFKF